MKLYEMSWLSFFLGAAFILAVIDTGAMFMLVALKLLSHWWRTF